MTVVVGGSLVAAATFLLHYSRPALAVAVLAAGIVLAVLEGSFRVWDATDRQLQEARAGLRELDTVEAKRSHVDEMDAEARQLGETVESLSEEAFYPRRRTIDADIRYWEDGVRATLRKSFERGDAELFDSDEGVMTDHDRVQVRGSKGEALAYLARRRRRLAEIRAKLE